MNESCIHSGFISLIGRPNTGKSTLLNHLAGIRLAITSPKAQTTRQVIRAILDDETSQMIFLDTPGVHKSRTRLGDYMAASTAMALADGDIILLLIDADAAVRSPKGPKVPDLEAEILEKASQMKKPVILVLNKVDRTVKESLLPLLAAYAAAFDFAALIPISALTGDGISQLVETMRGLLPAGPRYFPAESLTDQTERELAGELVREQILMLTSEEIPHGTAVEIESFEEFDKPGTEPPERERVRISASIYCDKDSHKGILIGKNGSMLKKIGTAARLQIEHMLDCTCYLELHVKVRDDWRNRIGILRNLGYEIRK
ncbi:MAG TPA: GTPase Era [Clostridiales bacterium]|nr:GTPase Era [Clostridiales bacterium]